MKLILFFFSFFLVSESIKNVKYLKEDYSFSKPSEVFFENGKYTKFTENSNKTDFYLIPSFCDVYATIGNDSNLNIETKLESFLKYGFSHIQLVADKKEILKPNLKFPLLYFSEKNFLPSNKDFTLNKYSNYDLIYDYSKLNFSQNSINEFFYKNDSSAEITSSILNQWNLDLKKNNSALRIHTFADNFSIMDALVSGNRILIHPISSELLPNITQEHLKEIYYTPILNVYQNLRLDNKEESEGANELILFKKSKFFQNKLANKFEEILSTQNLTDEEKLEMKNEYLNYLKFIQTKPEILDRIELGSGTGNRLSFAGISGIREYLILYELFPNKKNLLKIITENSCKRVSKTYRGKMGLGEEANFLLVKENPVQKPEIFLNISNLYLLGKKIY